MFVKTKKYREALLETDKYKKELTSTKIELSQKNIENRRLTNEVEKLKKYKDEVEELKEKLKELEAKNRELEFCLSDCKKANFNLGEMVKRTNKIKRQLEKLLISNNNNSKKYILVENSTGNNKIKIKRTIDTKKCYEIVRELG